MDFKHIFETNSGTLQIVGLVLLVAAIIYLIKKRSETMYDVQYSDYVTEQPQMAKDVVTTETAEVPVVSVIAATGQDFSSDEQNFMGSAINFETTGKDVLPMDLLPKSDIKMAEGELTPTSDLSARNYLVSSNNFGIDTVGSSNKLANLQLRSDPYIASKEVGPWNNSSVTANTFSRSFDIGS